MAAAAAAASVDQQIHLEKDINKELIRRIEGMKIEIDDDNEKYRNLVTAFEELYAAHQDLLKKQGSDTLSLSRLCLSVCLSHFLSLSFSLPSVPPSLPTSLHYSLTHSLTNRELDQCGSLFTFRSEEWSALRLRSPDRAHETNPKSFWS
jgi:hypothetical protein